MLARNAEIERLHRLVSTLVDPDLTDRELLRRFNERQDAVAFEVLIRRHGSMVLAAGRRVLGNAQDAEDVYQATFLLLAQKASSRKWQSSVGNWLHRVAHLLALKARRSSQRRARREGSVTARTAATSDSERTGQELLAILDEELLALPERLRAPLILCYLEGATRDEAAVRLGCPLSTLKKRLERGRDRLRDALVRRGWTLSAALLGTLLVEPAAAAVPISLVQKTAEAALMLATGSGTKGLLTDRVIQLVNNGIDMTTATKLIPAFGVLLLGTFLAVGAIASNVGENPPAQPPPKQAAAIPDKPAEAAPSVTLQVIVLDPQGKPLPGANIHVGVWTEEKDFQKNRDLETDAAGVARIDLPKTFTSLRLWAGKKSFATMHASWEQGELAGGKGVPAEYAFRLEVAGTAGGRVLDENGKPIAGAKVEVRLANDPKPARSDGRVRYAYWFDVATTDLEGRWQIENVPYHPEAELSLLVTHPDYASDGQWTRRTSDSGKTTAALRDGTATYALKSGVVVRGRVTDSDDKPIANAVVVQGKDDPYRSNATSTFSTDAEGNYRLPAGSVGPSAITVFAPGRAPQFRAVELKPDLPAQDFRLSEGKPVRLRIVDADGKPVPKASVKLIEWKGSKSIASHRNPNHPKMPETGIPKLADADGIWAWPAAPDSAVKVQVFARGFAVLEMDVTGGSTDRTVTLKAEHRIAGTVTDAVTGKPILAFTIIPVDVFGKDFLHAERDNAVAGKDGRLDYLADRIDIPLRLRVEAPGYRTQDGPEFRVGTDDSRKQDFRLTPSRPVSGLVVDGGGKPVAKAEVLLATPTEPARLSKDQNNRSFTDSAGRFAFPDPGEPWAVIARTDSGVASAEFPAERTDAGILRLQPWSSIRGTFHDGGKPVSGATVFATPIGLVDSGRPRLDTALQTVTGKDGQFEFQRVSPGAVSVRVHLGPWKDVGFRSGPSVPLDLKPGQHADLKLGSGGAVVAGKVKLIGKVPADLDCTYSLNQLVRREPGVAPPAEVATAGFDARKGWQDAWSKTPEGHAYLSTLQSWFVKLSPDGTFQISGVPAGDYDLSIRVYAKPNGCLVDPLARQVVTVRVAAADVARGTLSLPEVATEVVPVPAVGDIPTLAFQRTDSTNGTLADYREKYTVVHFWMSWCGPCKKQLPTLKKLHERFAARGLATLSLSLDDNPLVWRATVKKLDMAWPQGRLEPNTASGVSSTPAYWLLDPAGKILIKAYDPDELLDFLEAKMRK